MGKYIYGGIYFVRQSVLSTKDAQNNPLIDETNQLKSICQNPAFRQAILYASESLYYSMNNYMNGKIKDLKKKWQIELSLSQYWMRMSTRATPFGLFSHVSLGDLRQGCEAKKMLHALIDADCEWILSLSKSLENQNFEKLSFVSNGLISDEGTFYRLPYIPGSLSNVPIAVKKTEITSYLVNKCNYGEYSYCDLMREFQRDYPGIDTRELNNAIQELLLKEFLISELRPNLSSPHLLKALLKRLENKKISLNIVEQLRIIVRQMEYVADHIFEEESEEYLRNIVNEMRELNDTTHVIKMDLINKGSMNILTENDIKELEDFANFFVEAVARSQNKFTLYDEYKDYFQNTYGDYQLVQLSKMLNEQKGIGIPHDYKESRKKRKGIKTYPLGTTPELTQYALSKYREALQNNTSIDVEDLLLSLDTQKPTGLFPKAFELIFKVATDEEGKRVFICNKDYGCVGTGRAMGRFLVHWTEAKNAVRQLNELEYLPGEYLECDLMYLPQRVQLGNVATVPRFHDYCLAYYQYSQKQSIPISDIYVGIKDDRFFLYSKCLGKKLKINTHNLLYFYGDSPEIRFLKEIQLDGIIQWNVVFFKNLMNFDYLPEIRYKMVVIRPETWIINLTRRTQSFEEFDEYFLKKYIHLNDKNLALLFGDNELKINIRNKNSRYLIYRQYLRTGMVMLIRTYDCCLNSNAAEIVVPYFLKKMKEPCCSIRPKHSVNETYATCYHSHIILGDNWLSFELYGYYNFEEYISKELSALIDELCTMKIIESFYYLQYADPRYHIRLRLFKKEIIHNIEHIIEQLNKHVLSGYIESFKMCPYDREIERYGGKEGLIKAERLFCVDSRCAIFFIRNCSLPEREMYYVMSALEYMKIWNWELEQQLEWLEINTGKESYIENWRKIRSTYYSCFCEKMSYLPLELARKRADAIYKYHSMELSSLEMQNRILSALLHMSFNRVFGMNRVQEQKLLGYTRNILREIIYRKKKRK